MEPIEGKKAVPASDLGAATPRHRELYRLLLAGVDLDEATELAALAEDRSKTGELAGPLLEAAAVAYARVFADAPVLGPLPEKIAGHADPKVQWLHHQLLALRDKAASHAALASHPVVVHLYEQAAALEIVSSELKPEHLPQVMAHLKDLHARIGRDVVSLMTELFPDRRGAFHILLTGEVTFAP